MKRLIFLVLIVSSCFAMPKVKGFVEAGYFGNGDFSEEGFGGFNLDGRLFFRGKGEGLFVNLNPIIFAAGETYAVDNDLPTSFSSFQMGGGYQKYLSGKFYMGASCGVGFGSGTYPTEDSVLGIHFSSSENKTAMVTSYGCYLGFTAPAEKNFGFSGKIGLKGLIIDAQSVIGLEMSAGFRIGK